MKSFVRKFDGLRFFAVFAVVCLTCFAAFAEDGEEAEGHKKVVLTELQQRMQKRIDKVEFSNTSIDDVIRIIAEQAELNVVKDPEVTGNVTATLTDVPLEEALSNILAAHGYGYVVDKNVIRIAPREKIVQAAEALVSKIYRITYADVTEVAQALDKFKSPQGIVSFNKSTSNIIVTDTESKIKAIDTFIEQIDRITPQILVETRIYDITSRETLDLGVEWEAGRNTTYNGGIGVNPGPGRTDPFMTGGFLGATSETEDTTGAFRIGWLNDSIDIDAILRAQQEHVDAKLLANPRILVLDNETANFDIVREIPYVETSTTGNTATETIRFKNVGVQVQVTPHVTRDGMLRLHIMPEFGVIVGQDAVTNVPTVDTRKLNTIALVQDGQTVVLGGLRKKDVTHQMNKVPLLGDLPLVGILFRFEGEDTANTELVIFITPTVVEQPIIMSPSEEQAYELTEFSGPDPVLTRSEKNYEE
jgi:type IV pilus assembly protein PilQ